MQCGTSEVCRRAVCTATMTISAYCRNAVDASVSAKNQCTLSSAATRLASPDGDQLVARLRPNILKAGALEILLQLLRRGADADVIRPL